MMIVEQSKALNIESFKLSRMFIYALIYLFITYREIRTASSQSKPGLHHQVNHSSDWLGVKRISVFDQINRKSMITIQIWFDLTRLRNDPIQKSFG